MLFEMANGFFCSCIIAYVGLKRINVFMCVFAFGTLQPLSLISQLKQLISPLYFIWCFLSQCFTVSRYTRSPSRNSPAPSLPSYHIRLHRQLQCTPWVPEHIFRCLTITNELRNHVHSIVSTVQWLRLLKVQTFPSECVQHSENSGVNSMASFVRHTEIDSCSMMSGGATKMSFSNISD